MRVFIIEIRVLGEMVLIKRWIWVGRNDKSIKKFKFRLLVYIFILFVWCLESIFIFVFLKDKKFGILVIELLFSIVVFSIFILFIWVRKDVKGLVFSLYVGNSELVIKYWYSGFR